MYHGSWYEGTGRQHRTGCVDAHWMAKGWLAEREQPPHIVATQFSSSALCRAAVFERRSWYRRGCGSLYRTKNRIYINKTKTNAPIPIYFTAAIVLRVEDEKFPAINKCSTNWPGTDVLHRIICLTSHANTCTGLFECSSVHTEFWAIFQYLIPRIFSTCVKVGDRRPLRVRLWK